MLNPDTENLRNTHVITVPCEQFSYLIIIFCLAILKLIHVDLMVQSNDILQSLLQHLKKVAKWQGRCAYNMHHRLYFSPSIYSSLSFSSASPPRVFLHSASAIHERSLGFPEKGSRTRGRSRRRAPAVFRLSIPVCEARLEPRESSIIAPFLRFRRLFIFQFPFFFFFFVLHYDRMQNEFAGFLAAEDASTENLRVHKTFSYRIR